MRWRVRVGVGQTFNGKRIDEGGKVIVPMPLSHFAKADCLTRTVLLGEHLRDTLLYETMTRAYAAELRISVGIAFERRHGGGDTTAPVFSQEIAEGRLILAIVDSDRRYPGAPVGGTASKFVALKPLRDIHHYEILHVRSAECLISSDVYEQVFVASERHRAAMKMLQERWRDYADMKASYLPEPRFFVTRTRAHLRAIAAYRGAKSNQSAKDRSRRRDQSLARCQRPSPSAEVELGKVPTSIAIGGTRAWQSANDHPRRRDQSLAKCQQALLSAAPELGKVPTTIPVGRSRAWQSANLLSNC